MAKTSAKKTSRAPKGAALKVKGASRTSKGSALKVKGASRTSKGAALKVKGASRTSKGTALKVKGASRTSKVTALKAKGAPRTSKKTALAVTEDPNAPIMEPTPYWRPEYMGTIYALSSNIPDYMPRNEADLMVWMKAYIDNTSAYTVQFPAVFSNTAPFPHNILLPLWTRINNARNYIQSLADILRSWRTLNKIYLHASEHKLTAELGIPPAPPASGGTTTLWVGLIGIIDAQVRLLRAQPNFNQAIAELFGIVPKRPPTVDPTTVNPNLRGKNTGGEVVITFRAAAGIKGAAGAFLRVNRGDGKWHDLAMMTTASRIIDAHVQPAEPGVWIYEFYYVNERGNQVGGVHQVVVTVPFEA